MKIQPIINSYSFKARRKEIRKADDIVRKVNQEFPAFSPTYVKRNWFLLKNIKDGYSDRRVVKHSNTIEEIRAEARKNKNQDKFLLSLFENIKNKKVGNCAEKCHITMGALSANGYTDCVNRISVGIEWKITDNRTGEKVYSEIFDLDHKVILTTMTNENPKNLNDLIIIDPWLNKAMSISEAEREYSSQVKKKKITETKNEAIANFVEKNKKDFGILGKKLPVDFNLNNYKYKYGIAFYQRPQIYGIKNEDFEEFGKIVAPKYPELVLK